MLKSAVLASVGLLLSAGIASADSACQPLLETATGAGLVSLAGALQVAGSALADTALGPILAAAQSSEVLPEDERVTIFAPTDDAFAIAAETFGGTLPQEAVADVLLNHVVAADLTSAAILEILGEEGGSIVVTTLLGSEIYVTTDGSSLFLQSRGLDAPGATVIIADQITCVGPVHVVDLVLLPFFPDGSTSEFPVMAPVAGPVAEGPGPLESMPPMEVMGPSPSMGEPVIAPEDMMPGMGPEMMMPGPEMTMPGPEMMMPAVGPDMMMPGEVTDRGLGPVAVDPGMPSEVIEGSEGVEAPAEGPGSVEEETDSAAGVKVFSTCVAAVASALILVMA